ncbi:MAG: alkaline phosphatase family protein [Candidatus Krumholzibacteriaceae bacterium]|jgi:hypothetical protein
MGKPMIVIIIDALGYELTASHGFHPAGLASKARLKTVLGFSQAALASIFTASTPAGHGLWMMYSFAEKGSPFGWLSLVPPRVSARRLWLRRLIQWDLAHRVKMQGYYSLYDVPREILPRLDLPARGDMFAPRGGGAARTIFDELEERRMPHMVWDYRVSEARAFDDLQEAVRVRQAGFYLLYTAGLDSDLHRHGTTAPRIGEHLAWYRQRIERLAAAAGSEAEIVVLGDHGMCDVTGSIGVMSAVEALGLEIGRDYVPFYDSTMARFRIRSERSREVIGKYLGGQPSGRLLSSDEMRRLGVAFPDGRFGDIVFLADPGVVIAPSYMGAKPVAAMHGYHPDVDQMYSAMFSTSELPAAELSIMDVAGIVLPGFTSQRGGKVS